MANTATVTTLSTLRQRNLIARAVELKSIIDGAKDEFDEILGEFKSYGDNEYQGRDGHKVLVYSTERVTLDSKIIKGFLTPAQVLAASKVSYVTTAKVQ
jgi:hypothetical protein